MSSRKKSPSPSPPPPPPTRDLKSRVISCLNRLSDRDTLALATSELESIALNLTNDSFSSFLSCIHNTDDASRSPVRRQCVNVLALLSRSHGDALSPHLPKIVSIITRRLRDADSAVRLACVAAAAAVAAKVTRPPFSLLMKPLMETLAAEQDANSQIGAAMCIAAAVEAAPEPEVEVLRRALPRVAKLLKSEGFKGKAAAMGMIGSIVGVSGVVNKGILDWLVPCALEFLSSEDWNARKAAAEALGRVAAVAERELVVEHKASCVKCLESRRFDKVKMVRETMNRTLELWKEVADLCEDGSAVSHSLSSPSGSGIADCLPALSKSLQDISVTTPEPKKQINRSSPSNSLSSLSKNFTRKEIPLKYSDKSSPISSALDQARSTDSKVQIAHPLSTSLKLDHKHDIKITETRVLETGECDEKKDTKGKVRRALFGKNEDDKVQKSVASKSGSRVVPFDDLKDSDLSAAVRDEEMEDLSLIRKQLAQIENQQSSLFDLLQNYIGRSQSGMNSLETRVHGLEMAIEEISYDIALSTGRFPNVDSADYTCCKLPGTEFLSSKFWRRAEGRCSTTRLSSSDGVPLTTVLHGISNKSVAENHELGSQRVHNQYSGSSVVHQEADVQSNSRESFESCLNKTSKRMVLSTERMQFHMANGINGSSSGSFGALGNLRSRLSA
ncbi:TORTIFOLIA1-like protein 4 [Rhodamnia argentea]|uniref:TORTIFOLIA1-like protein 4 n=1 Tax=Rhodamnia argentea TaxID=178133 RepID=A0A8B8MSD4_9MYRT|nr:TORTIFOLIA1-like protein 4 [Rhodamnia argentea]